MQHPRVRLLVVTGGEGVVKVAMRSGKRAICAGPGNPPVVVDETADLDKAARDIVLGASFDNNIVCVLEKEIIAVDRIADDLKASLCRSGCVEVAGHQLRQLEKVIFQEMRGPGQPGVINKEYIGKCADVILRQIGIRVGKEVRLAIVEVDREHPLFLTEQMMPVMPLVRVRNADEGIDLAIRAEHGFGHTAAMHSKNIDHLSRMAREINTSIFVKNGPSVAGLGYGGEGHTSFSIASPTGEGLTSARHFSRDRRCVLVDHFRIV
jgi:aldehyde dehydrogenase